MSFAHAQAAATAYASSAISLDVVLTNNPALGDVVVVGVLYYNATSTPPVSISVADSNGNSYIKTPNSPASAQASTAGFAYVYYLVAPSNASKTITLSCTQGTFLGLIADDFTVTGAAASFDKDAAGSGTTGTTINTPSITPSAAGELLTCFGVPSGAISSVNSPWTQGGIDAAVGTASGYILSASGSAQALNMTQSSGHWDSIAAAFRQAAATGLFGRSDLGGLSISGPKQFSRLT